MLGIDTLDNWLTNDYFFYWQAIYRHKMINEIS